MMVNLVLAKVLVLEVLVFWLELYQVEMGHGSCKHVSLVLFG